MNDGGIGILGVIVGALIVIGIIMFFAFGDRLGLRHSGPGTTIKVEAPKAPTPVPK